MLPGTPAPAAPHHDPVPATAAAGDDEAVLDGLRAASARVTELGSDGYAGDAGADDHVFDAAEHAARFEELHEALTAVLAELDRT